MYVYIQVRASIPVLRLILVLIRFCLLIISSEECSHAQYPGSISRFLKTGI